MPLKVTKVPVSSLSTPPQHDKLFGPPDPAEIARIATEMSKQGLLDPLHISADLNVVVGVKQFLAAQKLGWEAIDVYHHQDWVDDATIERHLIADARGRNLSDLARARCARRLIELQEQSAIDDLPSWRQKFAKATLKSDVVEELGRSPREVNRLLKVERTPLAVQLACDAGKLTLGLAGHVDGLPKDVQQEIADEIQAGGDPKVIVTSRLPAKPRGKKETARSYARFLKAVRSFYLELANNVDDISTSSTSYQANLETLTSLNDLIEALIAREHHDHEVRSNGQAALQEVIDRLKRPK